jgi:diguanylate cyclase (GGDEF)-like protein
LARGRVLHKALNDNLNALSNAAATERMRLALAGADEAVFDWTLADDMLVWDGADNVLRHHIDISKMDRGQALRAWLSPAMRARFDAFIDEVCPLEPGFMLEFDVASRTQRDYFEIRAVRFEGEDGTVERVVGVLRRVTEQKALMAHLSFLATCDELTGQLNRTRLREELSRVIGKAEREGRSSAYFVAGIDKLAIINETYGFDVADEVIVATGKRLANSLRGSDIIGRTAGNKFGVVLSDCGEDEMAMVAERLHLAVRREVVETRAGPVSATISVGAVALPKNASTSQEAMLQADEALERAKGMGRSGFAVYTRSAQRESARRRLMTIADDTMSALNENRLILSYQPIVGAKSRLPEHYECLLRMTRTDGSLAVAGEFIPAAESLGLVRLVDWRALEMTPAQLRAHPTVKLSLNVSGTTANDQSWLNAFVDCIRENHELASRLTVELTETAALQAFEDNARFVSRLRELGCRVAIDDFGAGYTSFRNLHMLRFDMVKIDGSYVKNLSHSPDNQVFVRTLVDLAKNFHLETVAEWVDSEEDACLLAEYGVDYFQGFHFGRPDTAPAWANLPAIAS